MADLPITTRISIRAAINTKDSGAMGRMDVGPPHGRHVMAPIQVVIKVPCNLLLLKTLTTRLHTPATDLLKLLYIYIYICIHIFIHSQYSNMCIYTIIYTHIRNIYIYIYTYIHTCAYVFLFIRIYTYIYIYIIYIYTGFSSFVYLPDLVGEDSNSEAARVQQSGLPSQLFLHSC